VGFGVRVLRAMLVLMRVHGSRGRCADVLAGLVSRSVSSGFELRVVWLAELVNAVRVRFVGFASGVCV
jgi:hypothetical protein